MSIEVMSRFKRFWVTKDSMNLLKSREYLLVREIDDMFYLDTPPQEGQPRRRSRRNVDKAKVVIQVPMEVFLETQASSSRHRGRVHGSDEFVPDDEGSVLSLSD